MRRIRSKSAAASNAREPISVVQVRVLRDPNPSLFFSSSPSIPRALVFLSSYFMAFIPSSIFRGDLSCPIFKLLYSSLQLHNVTMRNTISERFFRAFIPRIIESLLLAFTNVSHLWMAYLLKVVKIYFALFNYADQALHACGMVKQNAQSHY